MLAGHGRLHSFCPLVSEPHPTRWNADFLAGRRGFCSRGQNTTVVLEPSITYTRFQTSRDIDRKSFGGVGRVDVPRETSCIETIPLLRFAPWGTILARVIAIANQKGGGRKTTTAINLSASLAVAEQRTLLIDSDPQGNTTTGIGFPKDPSRRTLYHTLVMNEPFDRIVMKTQVEGLDLIPSDKNLAGAAVELVAADQREFRLKQIIEQIRANYSYIIIDCPPALD